MHILQRQNNWFTQSTALLSPKVRSAISAISEKPTIEIHRPLGRRDPRSELQFVFSIRLDCWDMLGLGSEGVLKPPSGLYCLAPRTIGRSWVSASFRRGELRRSLMFGCPDRLRLTFGKTVSERKLAQIIHKCLIQLAVRDGTNYLKLPYTNCGLRLSLLGKRQDYVPATTHKKKLKQCIVLCMFPAPRSGAVLTKHIRKPGFRLRTNL